MDNIVFIDFVNKRKSFNREISHPMDAVFISIVNAVSVIGRDEVVNELMSVIKLDKGMQQ